MVLQNTFPICNEGGITIGSKNIRQFTNWLPSFTRPHLVWPTLTNKRGGGGGGFRFLTLLLTTAELS